MLSLTNVAAGTVIAGFVFAAVRYMYRQVRRNEITQDFVVSIATNHIPHVYHALGLICDKLEIELTEPPVIDFHDYEKKER